MPGYETKQERIAVAGVAVVAVFALDMALQGGAGAHGLPFEQRRTRATGVDHDACRALVRQLDLAFGQIKVQRLPGCPRGFQRNGMISNDCIGPSGGTISIT